MDREHNHPDATGMDGQQHGRGASAVAYRAALREAIERAEHEHRAHAGAQPGGSGRGAASVVEVKLAVPADGLEGLKSQIERDERDAEALGHAAGGWAAGVLSDEQRTRAVVSLVASRVNELAIAREDQRSKRVGVLVSLATVTLVAVFAIIGVVFQQAVEEGIDFKVGQAEASIAKTVNEQTAIEVARAQAAFRTEVRGDIVPGEVTTQIEMDRLFLEGMVLSVQFDLGTSFSRTDRDRMVAIMQRFAEAPKITERPGFRTILDKATKAFVAAGSNAEIDRMVELFPDSCWSDAEISRRLMEHYGELLVGTAPVGWDDSWLVQFRQACSSVPIEYEGQRLAFQLLVAACQHGTDSQQVASFIESASRLRAIGDTDLDSRQVFLSTLLSSAHWIFLSKTESGSSQQQVVVFREILEANRPTIYAIADALGAETIGEILLGKITDEARKGQSSEDIGAALFELLDLFADRGDVQQRFAQLLGSN
ncbi:MAG: hypothetical protein RIB58_01760 [Phycisphaerales bacterium]